MSRRSPRTTRSAERDAPRAVGEPLKVLYLAGWFRSGSTILGQLLGSLDGFFFGGELRYFWRDVLADRDRCGCGATYARCDLWRAVKERVADVDRERMLALDGRLLLTRRLGRAGGDAGAAREYAAGLARLYEAIRRVTRARVLVDSSKAPSYALALSRLPGVRLSVVHLVRDPRATAYSRLRDPDPDDTGVVGSALLWDVWNLLTERWFASEPEYARVRHEDLAARPRETIERLLRSVGEEGAGSPVTSDGLAMLGENHSLAGNDARFRVGDVRIHPDEVWRQSLPRRHRVVVGALTSPVLGRYGYAISAREA